MAGIDFRPLVRIAGMVQRRPDWPERLADVVEAARHAEFAWGTHDCAMFAADAVLAMTGIDPLEEWRGAYDDEVTGDAITSAAGGFEAFMVRAWGEFGAMECAPAIAQRGDVALVSYGNTLSMGVSLGGAVVVPGLRGLAFLSPRMMTRAWAI